MKEAGEVERTGHGIYQWIDKDSAVPRVDTRPQLFGEVSSPDLANTPDRAEGTVPTTS